MSSASERLRTWLAFYRDGDVYHRGGMPFEIAWPRALAQATRDESDGPDSERAWIVAHREVWRRAYEREPPSGADVALLVLVASVDRARLFADLVCALPGCDRLVVRSDGRQANKIYCCDGHRRAAYHRSEAQRRRALA